MLMLHPYTQTYRPRDMRTKFLEGAPKSRRGAAITQALACIDARFDEAVSINRFKLDVERIILFGPAHQGVKARYGQLARMFDGIQFGHVLQFVSGWYVRERHAFQIASALGCEDARIVRALREIRLILRWMRRQQMDCQFQAIIDEVLQ